VALSVASSEIFVEELEEAIGSGSVVTFFWKWIMRNTSKYEERPKEIVVEKMHGGAECSKVLRWG